MTSAGTEVLRTELRESRWEVSRPDNDDSGAVEATRHEARDARPTRDTCAFIVEVRDRCRPRVLPGEPAP